jgi:hypothetical protein
MALNRTTTIGGVIGIVVIVALILGGLYVYKSRCPKCGTFFAMQEISRVKTGEKRVNKTERRNGRSRQVTVNRTFFMVTDKCKKCGFVKTYETHTDNRW